ncbi:MAG: MFS transporter [Chloroflexi bacterium]|nr:MFS transporter [Chloroflexota bacterium]
MGILIILIAPYLDLIGMSAPQIGLVFTISLVGSMVLSIPATFIGDLIGRRRLFVVMSLTVSVASIALAITDSFVWLAAGSFFGAYAASGLNHGPLLQLEQASIAEVSGDKHRTAAFAWLGIISSAARGVGNIAGVLPALIVIVLGANDPDSFKITFGLYALLNFGATALYLFLTPAIELERGEERPKAVNPLKLKSRNRILGLALLLGVDSFAGGMIADTFISLWLVKHFNIGVGVIGVVFVAVQILNSFSLWVAAWLAKRWGLLNTMVWTQTIANLLVLAFVFSPWAWLAIFVWVMRGFWNEMDVPTRQSYSMAVVSPADRMPMAGTANFGRAALRVPGPAITGALWAASITATPFVIAVAVKLAYNIALWRTFKSIVPPEER